VQSYRCSNAQFTRAATLLTFGLPLVFAIGLYGLLGIEVPSDVPTYYYLPGLKVLEGKVPYRDFTSSYAPLFSYVSASLIQLWDSPKVFVFFAIFVNGLSLPLWLNAARNHFEEDLVRRAACLYIFNPTVFFSILVGKNDVWAAFFLALSLNFTATRRASLSGLLLGLGFVSVKLLVLLFAPMFFAIERARVRWTLWFCAPIVTVYSIFIASGIDVFAPAKTEGSLTSGGNLPFLLSGFGIMFTPIAAKVWMASLGVVMAVATLLFLSRSHQRSPVCAWFFITFLMCLFLCFSRKSYSSYLALCFFISLAKNWKTNGVSLLLAGVFLGTLALEPSLYHRITDPLPNKGLSALLTTSPLQNSAYSSLLVLLIANGIVVSGYIWTGWRAFRSCLGYS
jgi:hypothetical protein